MQTIKIPDWLKQEMEAARFEDRQARIAALPRFKIMFGKNWAYGPWCYVFGLMWDKEPNPEEGSFIYRRRFIIHLTFHISLERC